MKKDILNQFKNFSISRELANTIVGGYQPGGGGAGGSVCNNVGCPTSGGSCTYKGTCQLNGRTYGVYSCTQPGTSQAVIDSTIAANLPGTTFIFQGPYTVTCTGAAGA